LFGRVILLIMADTEAGASALVSTDLPTTKKTALQPPPASSSKLTPARVTASAPIVTATPSPTAATTTHGTVVATPDLTATTTSGSAITTTPTPVPSAKPEIDPFPDLIKGYPKLAGRMGMMPEIAMFRRFGALNARNLLYLQNDLMMLEARLKKVEAADQASDSGRKKRYAFNAFWLSTANVKVDGQLRDGDTVQRDLILEMRTLLNQYS
jgi:hypothetical protein